MFGVKLEFFKINCVTPKEMYAQRAGCWSSEIMKKLIIKRRRVIMGKTGKFDHLYTYVYIFKGLRRFLWGITYILAN